jgi:hypothetical protein
VRGGILEGKKRNSEMALTKGGRLLKTISGGQASLTGVGKIGSKGGI